MRAAGAPMLAGGLRRSSSAATSGAATAQPTRSAASPNAFDIVRSTIRFGCTASCGTHVTPAYSKYASSTTTAASGCARASAAISAGSRSAPVGLLGLQTQIKAAPSGSVRTSAPSSSVTIR